MHMLSIYLLKLSPYALCYPQHHNEGARPAPAVPYGNEEGRDRKLGSGGLSLRRKSSIYLLKLSPYALCYPQHHKEGARPAPAVPYGNEEGRDRKLGSGGLSLRRKSSAEHNLNYFD